MKRTWQLRALSFFLLPATALLHADVIVNGSLHLTHFQILASGGNVTMMSPVTASAFAEALDGLGALDQNFNSADDAAIAVAALTTLAGVSASASGLNLTAGVAGGIHIPGLDTFASATAQTDLSGFFLVSGPGPVDVQFSATIDANQSVATDSSGVSASSEVAFTLTLDNGDQPLFFDNILPLNGPDMSATQSFSETLTNHDLLTPGLHRYDNVLDYEPRGLDSHVPEPSSIFLLIGGVAMLLMMRRPRASLCRERNRIGRLLVPAVLVVALLGSTVQAKDKGENKPPRDCPVCACTGPCPAPLMQANSDGGTSISLTMGDLTETADLSSTSSAFGPTLPFQAVYNSYDADGSRAQIDTTMGYGWTHSYNTFLFSQFGSMFRYDSAGRITKYKLGPGGTFTASTGYFETLAKNPDGSFTITQKDQTKYTFALVPGTPFLVSGPAWRFISVVDRNGNATTLTYTAGNLTSIIDTYGRTITLTYTAQNKLASITDPAGRVTTFQYDSTGRKLIRITDPLGNSIQYSYNILYQLTGKIDKDGRTFSYMYVNGEPVAVLDGTNASRATLSNPNNWATDPTALASTQARVYLPSTTSVTDGRGNVWRYQYDANGYVTKTVAPDGATATYTYDPATLMVSSRTDTNGHTTSYQYDPQGNLTRMTDALGFITTYTYEPIFNMRTSVTDPKSRVTTYSYDGHGNRIQETDPLGQTRHWKYDAHGNILTATDKNGHTTSYQYDISGNRSKVTDPLGNITTMTYDGVGNMLSRTDANGHTTSYQYDGLNRLIRETDPALHDTLTSYDGEGNRTQVTDRNGHITTYQYDLRRRLIKTTDALGKPETYTYDGNNNRVSMTDRNGHVTIYSYDVQNRRTGITDALGNTTTTVYDATTNVLSQTDANGHTTTYSYDALDRRVTVTDALGNLTLYHYDTGGPAGCPTCGSTPGTNLMTSRTDANGKVTYFKYDALDRQTMMIRKMGSTADTITPADAVTTYGYDPAGNRVSLTEPDGNTTLWQYDADDRRIQQTNAAGDVTQTAYDGVGNVIVVTAPNGNVTSNTYDALNRLVQVSDSVGLVARDTYDPVGNQLSYSDGNGNTTIYGYDALNRLVATTDPLGHTSTSQYDAVGNVVKTIDRDGQATLHGYDAIDRRISTTDALLHTTQFQYDPVGNLTTLTDANGHATQYQYDAINRPIRETYADGKFRRYTYDPVGNMITRVDQIGQTTTYSYNDLYFLLGRSYPSAVNDSFTYDLSGRMLTAQRGAWLDTFTYDGANRITQAVQNGHTVAYAYNIPGRTRTMTYPSTVSITERTDARSRLGRIDDGLSPPPIVQYSYDLGNRVTTRAYRNGTMATYNYNADNWIVGLDHSIGLTHIATFVYDFDNEGNKKFEQRVSDPVHSEAYQYDNVYRLINYQVGTLVGSTVPVPSTQTAYSLDPVGNWNSKTTDAVTQNRVHDAVNELVKIDAANITYDANGNLLNDTSYAYAYDEENRLTSAIRLSDSALVGQYQYDGLGRRVQKIANPAGTASTTRYFYDDARIIEEQDGVGLTLATYTYGNYIDEVLTMNRGGLTTYYHQNSLWSVAALTGGGGTTIESYRYDAYGQPTILDGLGVPVPPNAWGVAHSAASNPWLFTSRQLDEEAGLYFYRARYYDARQGRFLQVDPRWYVFGRLGAFRGGGERADHANQYAYAGDNPLRWEDPTGESYCVCAKPLPALPACTAANSGTTLTSSCPGKCGGLLGSGCPCTKLCKTTCTTYFRGVSLGGLGVSSTSYEWAGPGDVLWGGGWHCEDDCGLI